MRAAFYLLTLFGAFVFALCFFYALKDWAALQRAQFAWEALAARSPENLPALTVAQSKQNIHRINLFAEGVWELQGLTLCGLGLLGLGRGRERMGN